MESFATSRRTRP